MLTKSKVIASLNELPDQFSIDNLMDKLILISKVEEGLVHVKKGELFSTDGARNKIKKWSSK